ncbi:zinc ribbon domain-containing protein [Desulfonema magnum]|uniref:Zinc-ribbon 15 domain-containing protein n=1 Tax=Desulfonema magnum TaxID=45655 RepID=A0A975GSV3_9BACT|nr:zinc ribbon domain-containing protein [Desulfonema magnum]QTA92445.1 Zinc-ribbon 15 domain-containing protein [Desulfonema magnum]
MFLIAGISPKIKTLDDKPRLCPVCGLAQAYYRRTDHYFSLFFIPILRVKKGEPFIMCEKCERNMHEFGDEYNDWLDKQDKTCKHCGRALHQDFQYCPFCGKQV